MKVDGRWSSFSFVWCLDSMLIFQCVWFHIGKCFCFPLFWGCYKRHRKRSKSPSKTTICFRTLVCGRDFKKEVFFEKKTTWKKKHLWYIWVFLENRGTVPPKKNHLLKNRGFFLWFSPSIFWGTFNPCWGSKVGTPYHRSHHDPSSSKCLGAWVVCSWWGGRNSTFRNSSVHCSFLCVKFVKVWLIFFSCANNFIRCISWNFSEWSFVDFGLFFLEETGWFAVWFLHGFQQFQPLKLEQLGGWTDGSAPLLHEV